MKLMILSSIAICLFVNSGGNPVALEKMRTENDTIPIAKIDPKLALPTDRLGFNLKQRKDTKKVCKLESRVPFCHGRCKPGWWEEWRDRYGNKRSCWSGVKRYCCINQST